MVFASRIVRIERSSVDDVALELRRIPHVHVLGRCSEEHLVVLIEGHDREQIRDVVAFAKEQIPQIVAIDPDGERPASS